MACVLPGCDVVKPRTEMVFHLVHSPEHQLPVGVAQTLLNLEDDNAALKRYVLLV